MTDKETIEKYIMEFALNEEPLYIIISAVMEEGLCETPREVVAILVEMFKKGYLVACSLSGIGGDQYVEVKDLDENEIYSIIEKRKDFKEYPEGKEFFFQTSEKAIGRFKEEIGL